MEIIVRDMLGKVLFSKAHIYADEIPLNLDIAKGAYLIELWQESERVHQEKLIVK